jgi:hypothetical protein
LSHPGFDEVARAKKEAIDRIQDATTEEKEAAKAKVDQAVIVISGWIALIKFVPFILAVSTFSFFSA